jgi:hypothetical protein
MMTYPFFLAGQAIAILDLSPTPTLRVFEISTLDPWVVLRTYSVDIATILHHDTFWVIGFTDPAAWRRHTRPCLLQKLM